MDMAIFGTRPLLVMETQTVLHLIAPNRTAMLDDNVPLVLLNHWCEVQYKIRFTSYK